MVLTGVEIAGLAAAIITFIDFAGKIVGGAGEIWQSTTGATEQNVHVVAVVEDLEKVTRGLRSSGAGAGQPAPAAADPDLLRIAACCETLSIELATLLAKLAPKNKSLAQVIRASFEAWRQEGKVAAIEKHLREYRLQVLLRLEVLLLSEQSTFRATLDEIYQAGRLQSNENVTQLEKVYSSLHALIQASQEANLLANSNLTASSESRRLMDGHSAAFEGQEMLLKKIANVLIKLESLTTSIPRENMVLSMLSFPAMMAREEQVKDPFEDTYSWFVSGTGDSPNSRVREDVSVRFLSFLENPSRLFFISGSPGSGKSTLMRFIGHSHKTHDALNRWAGARRLVIVNIFFWLTGELLGRNLEGFHRAILYHTLRQCPELILDCFSTADIEGTKFTMRVLNRAVESLFEQLKSTNALAFCFFVDGLDEYEGNILATDTRKGDAVDREEISDMLWSWTQLDNVKVVCAARPDPIFHDVFAAADHIIDFHKLNREDLVSFARGYFVRGLDTPKRAVGRANCVALVEELVSMANGVFLWVALVVRTLKDAALRGNQDEEHFRRLLEECPSDLGQLISTTILSRIGPSNLVRRRSQIVLYLALRNPFDGPLNALAFSWLHDLNWCQGALSVMDFPYNVSERRYSSEETISRVQRVKDMLQELTLGLLEVREVATRYSFLNGRVKVMLQEPTLGLLETMEGATRYNLNGKVRSPPYFSYCVDFFHRSARDYLTTEEGLKAVAAFQSDTEIFCHLRQAEMQFQPYTAKMFSDHTADGQDTLRYLFESTFRWLSECGGTGRPAPLYFFEGLENLACSAPWDKLLRAVLILHTAKSERRNSVKGAPRLSFIHWAAYWSQTDFVFLKLRGTDGSSFDERGQNLLLTASLAANPELVAYLLERGRMAEETIDYGMLGDAPFYQFSTAPEYKMTTNVWMVFLRDFAANVARYCRKGAVGLSCPKFLTQMWLEKSSLVLEALLRAGADPSVLFILQAFSDEVELLRVELQDLLGLFRPSNQLGVEKLLATKLRDLSGTLSEAVDNQDGIATPISTFRMATLETLRYQHWGVRAVVTRLKSTRGLWGHIGVKVY